MKDELKVERYDASEIEAKKKKTLNRVATGVGAAALVTVLGYYGLVQGQGTTKGSPVDTKASDTVSVTDKNYSDSLARRDSIRRAKLDSLIRLRREMGGSMMGGNGAWFNSVVEFIG